MVDIHIYIYTHTYIYIEVQYAIPINDLLFQIQKCHSYFQNWDIEKCRAQ